MSTIKERLSFSTYPFKQVLGIALFLTLASISEACGPAATPYQTHQHSPNDPKYPGNQKFFAQKIFLSVIGQGKDFQTIQKENEQDSKNFLIALTEEIKNKRPNLANSFISTTLPSLDRLLLNTHRSWGNCKSNQIENIGGFLFDAITNESITDDEVAQLIALRRDLSIKCSNRKELALFSEQLISEGGNKYVRYLLAASLFYQSEFHQAIPIFEQVAKEEASWVTEASDYLVARSTLLATPQNWGSQQEYKAAVQALKLEAITHFEDYLSRYPNGLFSTSAKGLIRRAHFLAGNRDTYQELLNQSLNEQLVLASRTPDWSDNEREKFQELFIEFQTHSSDIDARDPMSILDLFFGHQQGWTEKKLEDISRLTTYSAMYKSYFAENHEQIIAKYRPNLAQLTQPELLLLIRATEQSGDRKEAVELWLSEETEATYTRSFLAEEIKYEAAESIYQGLGLQALLEEPRIDDDYLKHLFVESSCDESALVAMLESDTSQRNKTILFGSLAARYLKSQRFDSLHTMIESHPSEIIGTYSAIETAIRQLSKNADQGQAYMNIAYFMKQHLTPSQGLSDSFLQAESEPCNHLPEVASTATLNAGPSYYFNKSLEYFGGEKSLDEEKSLYYITICFKAGKLGRDSCRWGTEYPNELTSRQAFIKLHNKYKGGEWAQKAKYYY